MMTQNGMGWRPSQLYEGLISSFLEAAVQSSNYNMTPPQLTRLTVHKQLQKADQIASSVDYETLRKTYNVSSCTCDRSINEVTMNITIVACF